MFKISTCMCWQIENKKMSRIIVRHYSKVVQVKTQECTSCRKNEYFSVKLNQSNDKV